MPLTLLGGWTALQDAINFFLTAEQLAERLERLVARQWARIGSCMVKPPAQYLVVIGILRRDLRLPDYDHISRDKGLNKTFHPRALQAVPLGAKDAAPTKIWRN
jgi:ribonuclease I